MIDGEKRLNDVIRRVLSKQDKREKWNGQYIYVIQCNEFFKIGIATNPSSRLAELQVGNPYKLTMLRYWPSPDAFIEEDEIHSLLDQYRVRGEWFKLPCDILNNLLKG